MTAICVSHCINGKVLKFHHTNTHIWHNTNPNHHHEMQRCYRSVYSCKSKNCNLKFVPNVCSCIYPWMNSSFPNIWLNKLCEAFDLNSSAKCLTKNVFLLPPRTVYSCFFANFVWYPNVVHADVGDTATYFQLTAMAFNNILIDPAVRSSTWNYFDL